MKNYLGEGDVVDMVLAFPVTAGVCYKVNDIVAVAAANAPAGVKAPMVLMGLLQMPKKPGEAMLAGQSIYWDDVNKYLTVTAGALKRFGFTVVAAAAADATVTAYLYALS